MAGSDSEYMLERVYAGINGYNCSFFFNQNKTP